MPYADDVVRGLAPEDIKIGSCLVVCEGSPPDAARSPEQRYRSLMSASMSEIAQLQRVGTMNSDADQSSILHAQRTAREATWPAGVPRQIRYVHGEVPLTEYLAWRAQIHGDKPAFHFYGADISFARLERESSAVAAYLLRNGVCRGDRVAIQLQNCPQYVIAFWGIIKAGAVVVPVNPMFKATESAYELNDSGATVLFAQSEYLSMVAAVRDRTSVRHVIRVDIADYISADNDLPLPFSGARPDDSADALWSDAIADDTSGVTLPRADLDALAVLNYTGGTTGMPKGCEHTQRHMLYTLAATATARGSIANEEDTAEAISLSFLPVFWIAGENAAVISPIYTGGTCVMLTRWDPVAVLTCVDRFKVSAMSGTVDNYLELIDHPDLVKHNLSSLKAPSAMSFVTKLTPLIRQQWRDRVGPDSVLREGSYGMTETHTQDTFLNGFQDGDRDINGRPTFVGLPMPGTEIKICDFDTHEIVPTNVEGEIVVRSPSVMTAYWRNPKATAASMRDGWFFTGDLGVVLDDGSIRYLGRKKEMLKVNGMSVFPSELESLLIQNPGVGAVAVVGVADAERGERPRAYVEVANDRNVTVEELSAWANANIAKYKVPEFVLVDRIPRTATGKIRKIDLPGMGDSERPATPVAQAK